MFHLPPLAKLQVHQTASIRRKMARKHRLDVHFCDSLRDQTLRRSCYSGNNFEVHVLQVGCDMEVYFEDFQLVASVSVGGGDSGDGSGVF